MNNKEMLLKLLSEMNNEDIANILSEIKNTDDNKHKQENNNLHTIKRRGKGHSKKQSNKSKNQEEDQPKKQKNTNSKGKACKTSSIDLDNRVNKFDEMIKNVRLDPNEQKELSKAKQEDDAQRAETKTFKKPKRKSNLIDVVCCVCKDEYTISAALVHDVKRWKCNTCSCSAG